MTPALFFRLMAWFAAVVACLLGGLAVLLMLNGAILQGLLLVAVSAINVAGWRMFTRWSSQMRE